MGKYLDKDGLLYFWTKLKTLFNGKVDKVDGKGLSTNDYTTVEKTKLNGIANGANKTTVDSSLSSTSTNPVQNKEIYNALSGKAASNHTHQTNIEKYDGDADITLEQGGTYKLTAGGTTYQFDMPTITKSSLGLGNVDNTADANKNVKYATTAGSAPASDVSAWAKATTKPTYSYSEITGLGTAATKGVDESGTSESSANLITGIALASYLNTEGYAQKSDISSVYRYKGSIAFANKPTSGMSEGDTYNITNAFTTDNTFIEAERGKTFPAGTNISYTTNGWDVLAGFIDLSGYQTKNTILTNLLELAQSTSTTGYLYFNEATRTWSIEAWSTITNTEIDTILAS